MGAPNEITTHCAMKNLAGVHRRRSLDGATLDMGSLKLLKLMATAGPRALMAATLIAVRWRYKCASRGAAARARAAALLITFWCAKNRRRSFMSRQMSHQMSDASRSGDAAFAS